MDSSYSSLMRGIEEVIPEKELRQRLATSRPLVVKAGFDPTAPELHLGHATLLNKLRDFQDLGHLIHFIVGDFTARIGDPSGRKTIRPELATETIEANASQYQKQASKILDPDKTRFSFNSTWLDKLSVKDLVKLASQSTVARMLERNDFGARYAANEPIAIHEFLYPLFQGYDSVAIKADVEIGGSDQLFNMLLGRNLQREHNLQPQIVITAPLLIGLDGKKKMSKSFANTIPLESSPTEMFGLLMSISDNLMWSYLELLSFQEQNKIAQLKKQVADGLNPVVVKYDFAEEIVGRFHGKHAATEALRDFQARFREGKAPTKIERRVAAIEGDDISLAVLLKMTGMTASTSEAIRALKQGGVRINSERVSDSDLRVKTGSANIYQVGKKRFLEIKLEKSASN